VHGELLTCYNTNTGSTSVYADINSLSDIAMFNAVYPELAGIHIYGDDISFDSNYTVTSAIPILFHGNQTFGMGADAVICDPVMIGAGVTLTIASGTTVELISDDPTALNAIIGTDAASTIIVEAGATVQHGGDSSSAWATGTYKWDATGEAWVLQP